MNNHSEANPLINSYSPRILAVYAIIFFLIIIFLTAFLIVPRINRIFEAQNSEDIQVSLAREAKLFTNFVEGKKNILRDLAQFPSLVNAAMLSDSSSPALLDLVENIVIGGERGKLVLQNVAGGIVIQTTADLRGSYTEKEVWIENLLEGVAPYHFQLLDQMDNKFTYKISAPVKYNNLVEGILSAEITTPLDEVFISQTFDHHIAFKLIQGDVTVATKSEHIETIDEHSLALNTSDITIVYITDKAVLRQKEISLRNAILAVLFVGLAASFLLLAVYGYHIKSHDKNTGKRKYIFDHTYIIPAVVAAIGVTTSLTAYSVAHNIQQRSFEEERVAIGSDLTRHIKEEFKTKLGILESVAAFYNASNLIDRHEFEIYASNFTKKYSRIQALSWIPNVSFDARSAYIKQANNDGIDNFSLKEIGVDNRLKKAGAREQYFPIYYVEPMLGNEKVIGFDLASSKKRLAALSKAASSGSQVATVPLDLVEETETTTGILVFYPVYRKERVETPTARGSLDVTRGFVQIVLKAEKLLEDSIQIDKGILSAHVLDVTDADNPLNIYGDEIPHEKISYSRTFEVATRIWRIDLSTTTVENYAQWTPWLILASGLIFSTFVTTSLTHLIRRRIVVEKIVEERTADLRMFSSIAANSNDIFIVTDAIKPDCENDGPDILYVNDAFTRQTGYTKEEALGKSALILQGANTDQEQMDLIRDTLSRGEAYQGEMVNYTKDKNEYWIDVNISPLRNDEGVIVQYAQIQRNITDRIHYRNERERFIDKLTDSNEELARFAFVCSHDLQEPLRMIRSFSEKLQSHISSELIDDEKGQKYFHYITEGASRAQSLIADILTYSSIDSDTQLLEAIDGNVLLADIQNIMSEALQTHGGTITYDDLPILQGNKTQLYQLFQNLINNAMKYRDVNTVPEVHIAASDLDSHWQFSIIDNGIGIEQRHLGKIFDVFQRLHRRNKYAGTGVGLSICKKVVERHGGKLWVESELNVGSTFHFTILKPSNQELTNEEQPAAR